MSNASSIKQTLGSACALLKDTLSSLSTGDALKMGEILEELGAIGERQTDSSAEKWGQMDKTWFSAIEKNQDNVWSYLGHVTSMLDYTEFELFIRSNVDLARDDVWNFSKIYGLQNEMLQLFPVRVEDVSAIGFIHYTQNHNIICPQIDEFNSSTHLELYHSLRMHSNYLPDLKSYIATVLYMHLAYGFIRKILSG